MFSVPTFTTTTESTRTNFYIMKKLIYLSFIALTFATPGMALADDDDDKDKVKLAEIPVVQSFCQEYGDITNSADAVSILQSFIGEKEDLTMDEFMALGKVAKKLDNGKSLQKICNPSKDS